MQQGTFKLDKHEVNIEANWFYEQWKKGYNFNPTSKKWRELYHPKTIEDIYEQLQKRIKKHENE